MGSATAQLTAAWMIAAALLTPLPASAGPMAPTDVPGLSILGFSSDGARFAYEQFEASRPGREAWAEIVVLDTATGKPADGAPFSVADASGDTSAMSVRQMTYAAAGSAVWQDGSMGTVLVRGSGDPTDPAAHRVELDLDGLGPVLLDVRGFGVLSTACKDFGVASPQALVVKLLDRSGEPMRTILTERAPPSERMCPSGYGLVEVRAFPRPIGPPVLAMLVAMDRPGVGGRGERRYLGVVADLAKPAPAKDE